MPFLIIQFSVSSSYSSHDWEKIFNFKLELSDEYLADIRALSQGSSDLERRLLQHVNHGLSSRKVNNRYSPLNDILSSVNRLLIDWFD